MFTVMNIIMYYVIKLCILLCTANINCDNNYVQHSNTENPCI